ncbi:MAG: hypothetical protein JWO31_75 [Phycisphaerales bacterium]|nr:hypothetical protein [Phycisphaerales bacterium]
MNALPEQVLASPRLIEFRDQIVDRLDAEHAARRRFRDRLLADDRRAEFINGEVVEQVANKDKHTVCLALLATLVTTYVRLRGLGTVRTEQALVTFPRNDYCPDLCFWTAARGIGADPDQFVYPPPDFVIEVLSPSTEHRDRGVKFEDYEAHGVREYWIVDPEARTIEQYVERAGRYERAFVGAAGTVRSEVVAGFEMPAEAAFDDAAQMVALRQILQAG